MFMQETGDGELMVLHDLHSVLSASQQFEINQGIMAELARAGLQPEAPATSTLVSTDLPSECPSLFLHQSIAANTVQHLHGRPCG